MKLKELMLWCLDNKIKVSIEKVFCKIQQREHYRFKFTNLPKLYPIRVHIAEYYNLDWAIKSSYSALRMIINSSKTIIKK